MFVLVIISLISVVRMDNTAFLNMVFARSRVPLLLPKLFGLIYLPLCNKRMNCVEYAIPICVLAFYTYFIYEMLVKNYYNDLFHTVTDVVKISDYMFFAVSIPSVYATYFSMFLQREPIKRFLLMSESKKTGDFNDVIGAAILITLFCSDLANCYFLSFHAAVYVTFNMPTYVCIIVFCVVNRIASRIKENYQTLNGKLENLDLNDNDCACKVKDVVNDQKSLIASFEAMTDVFKVAVITHTVLICVQLIILFFYIVSNAIRFARFQQFMIYSTYYVVASLVITYCLVNMWHSFLCEVRAYISLF